jgi:subtilase family serine protease
MSQDTRRILSAVVFASLAVLLIAVPTLSQAANGGRPSNAQMLGAEDQSKQIAVTFWLNQHDKAGFDELVRQMYDRSSPNYHHWLTSKDYATRFAPSAAEMAIVRQHLAANNLKVVYSDKLNLAVTARGTVADVQRATGVQLNRVLINGETHRIPSAELAIPGIAGKLVYAVQGLADTSFKSHAKMVKDLDTGKPYKMPLSKISPSSKVGPAVKYFNANCLGNTQTHGFTDGLKPPVQSADYTGTRYGTNINNGPPNLAPCGYDAPQVDTAYGLTSLYKDGLDGTGETVVIVDAYGSDTIAGPSGDANIFAAINGLPPLVLGTNFNIYYPGGLTNCGGNTCGWDVETSLDVEWSHSVAPGANIALVLGLTNSSGDLDVAVLTAVEDGLGSVISNSYGIEEAYLATYDPAELVVEDAINELGASFGISVNFSSGDDGDFSYVYPEITVSMPASSPYATSVGGTSLFLNPDKSIKLQTGWGNNITRVASYAPNPPVIPPLFEGFIFGAGGGTSGVWPLPSYQASLGGSYRLVPDIGMVADPYTGVEFIDTEGGETFISVVGGTSLACPTFSGIWAVATQAAGTWLGQAAPILYSLPAGAITDVVAVNGPSNVTGHTHIAHNPVVNYTAAELVPPLQNTTDFVSTLYNGTSTRWYVLGFGLDTSLTTGPGWDNVTGLGTPNGASFVTAVAAAAN